MANVALRRAVLENSISQSEMAVDGNVAQYSQSDGVAYFNWPGFLTVDLGELRSLVSIRILLQDDMGVPGGTRSARLYKYRLLLSKDALLWSVAFDGSEVPSNGWQVFELTDMPAVRYVRLHGLWHSENPAFHVVQVEAHDSVPLALTIQSQLERAVQIEGGTLERGDGQPISRRIAGLIQQLQDQVTTNPLLNPKPFSELINELRLQVEDVDSINSSLSAIRREIISPVTKELEESKSLSRYSKWGFVVGLIGGVLAIVALGRDSLTASRIDYAVGALEQLQIQDRIPPSRVITDWLQDDPEFVSAWTVLETMGIGSAFSPDSLTSILPNTSCGDLISRWLVLEALGVCRFQRVGNRWTLEELVALHRSPPQTDGANPGE